MVAFFWEPKTNLMGLNILSFIHPLIQFQPVTDQRTYWGIIEILLVVHIQGLSGYYFFVNLESN